MLVGTETGDDAAVWRLTPDRALVVTADFITPIVDDVRTWGRIAATNSVSDIYAMGGRPLLGLNLVAWNTRELSMERLAELLTGAAEVGSAAGFITVGGHTIDDPEPKFGLCVIGEVHPDRILTNRGLRPGDALVLTKPLGTGVITTAAKRGRADAQSVDAAVATMLRTNQEAAAAALAAGASGATDVTGFGLLGHLGHMAAASSVDVALEVATLPLLPGARDLAAAGLTPVGSQRNLAWLRDRLDGDVDEVTLILLADAQTSGGLVFGARPEAAAEAAARLRNSGHACAIIGHAVPGSGRLHLH